MSDSDPCGPVTTSSEEDLPDRGLCVHQGHLDPYVLWRHCSCCRISWAATSSFLSRPLLAMMTEVRLRPVISVTVLIGISTGALLLRQKP